MIRRRQNGEPASEGRSQDFAPRETEAVGEAVGVVGGSMSGKGSAVNTGDLSGQTGVHAALQPKNRPAGVRAAIVAQKSGNADGAKGGRKAEASNLIDRETTSAPVPSGDKQAEQALWDHYKAQRGVWSEKMLMALETGIKGKKWFSLIDKVMSERTLQLAWEKVKSNAGGCGVDEISIKRFAKGSQNRLLAVRAELKQGVYRPQPVKRVWIPKAGSRETRPLGIPAVVDRVVQTALRMVIEPIFEHQFAPRSYGFRPGRGCKDALREVERQLRDGCIHVVDVDIKGYFDSIPHERLMGLIQETLADGRVLKLLEGYLQQGVMEAPGKVVESGKEGTPQGAVISPLLANIYLNPLDWLMEKLGMTMVRYADDMVILCRSQLEAQQALARLRQWCEEAGLVVHPEKTRVVNMGQPGAHLDFLGYRFRRNVGDGKLRRYVRPKSLKTIKGRLKPLTRRSNGRSLQAILETINPILRGVYGYFKHASADQLSQLDGWVRGRLRGTLRKRRGGQGRGHGNDHFKWPNHYFEAQGLFSLRTAREQTYISLQQGEHC